MAVAVCANRRVAISLFKDLAVPARPVKAQLIDPEVRVELLDKLGIGMAGAAELGYLFSFRGTLECFVLGQLDIIFAGIPSMTVLAAQPELGMNIRLKSLHRRLKSFLQPLMAFHARIFLPVKRKRDAQ
jgi:hypothetical protein